MRIKSCRASLVFKAIIVLIGCLALADQLGFFAGSFRPTFFYFFTNLSNLVVVAYFVGAIIYSLRQHASSSKDDFKNEGVWMPAWKYAATMAVVVTWLVHRSIGCWHRCHHLTLSYGSLRGTWLFICRH